jgi:hypothetical protein
MKGRTLNKEKRLIFNFLSATGAESVLTMNTPLQDFQEHFDILMKDERFAAATPNAKVLAFIVVAATLTTLLHLGAAPQPVPVPHTPVNPPDNSPLTNKDGTQVKIGPNNA